MPVINMNRSGTAFKIYDANGVQNGTLYNKELYVVVDKDLDDRWFKIWFFSPRGWTLGQMQNAYGIPGQEGAYTYKYGTFTKAYSNLGQYMEGIVFPVRRKCRIFDRDGNTVRDNIYAGDAVMVEGNFGHTHYTYPYSRLSIVGYRKSGVWQLRRDTYCDTDLEIGYSMYNEATTYSPAW